MVNVSHMVHVEVYTSRVQLQLRKALLSLFCFHVHRVLSLFSLFHGQDMAYVITVYVVCLSLTGNL
jgi:hypothetical protein